jgi:hypothetical protein
MGERESGRWVESSPVPVAAPNPSGGGREASGANDHSTFQSPFTTFRITPVSVVKPQWLSLV